MHDSDQPDSLPPDQPDQQPLEPSLTSDHDHELTPPDQPDQQPESPKRHTNNNPRSKVGKASYEHDTKLETIIRTLGIESMLTISKDTGIARGTISKWRADKDLMEEARTIRRQRNAAKRLGTGVSESAVISAISDMARVVGLEAAELGDLDRGKKALDLITKAAAAQKALNSLAEAGDEPLDPSKIR